MKEFGVEEETKYRLDIELEVQSPLQNQVSQFMEQYTITNSLTIDGQQQTQQLNQYDERK